MADKKIKKGLEIVLDGILNEITEEIFSRAQQNLSTPDANGRITSDTGNLMKSARFDISKRLIKSIVWEAIYAGVIEYGRYPGTYPPREPIKQWLMRKVGMPEKKANSVSYAIVQAIHDHGTNPRPYVRPAITAVLSKYGKRKS